MSRKYAEISSRDRSGVTISSVRCVGSAGMSAILTFYISTQGRRDAKILGVEKEPSAPASLRRHGYAAAIFLALSTTSSIVPTI
jgi:hypothetical protein